MPHWINSICTRGDHSKKRLISGAINTVRTDTFDQLIAELHIQFKLSLILLCNFSEKISWITFKSSHLLYFLPWVFPSTHLAYSTCLHYMKKKDILNSSKYLQQNRWIFQPIPCLESQWLTAMILGNITSHLQRHSNDSNTCVATVDASICLSFQRQRRSSKTFLSLQTQPIVPENKDIMTTCKNKLFISRYSTACSNYSTADHLPYLWRALTKADTLTKI